MFTLIGECHFWSLRDDIKIKSNDCGAFRYMRKAEDANLGQLLLAKRDYTEQRSGVCLLKNSRKAGSRSRLKDNIKTLEELLRTHKIVHSQWQETLPAQVILLFANGIVAHICIDIYTGDIQRLVFEKYLVSKLAADSITDAFYTHSHIVVTYNTNQLTVVYLQRPTTRAQGPEKIENMEPRIFHAIIPGPSERKLTRRMALNSSCDVFVIWTKSSQNEVYPWRPTIRDQDRANIHVFKLREMQLELMSYCWSENDPIYVEFLRSSESQILVVEQKVSRKGEISAEVCSYEISSGKMQRTPIISIAVRMEICSLAFSPDQEKLFVGTAAQSLYLHDLVLQSTKMLCPIEIMPMHCSWHCDSCLIMVANEHAQLQCFDLALTPISTQLQREELAPSHLLDLSLYFSTKLNLTNIKFSHKPELVNFRQKYAPMDCFMLLQFENGPIGCLRFFSGAGMRGDIHNSGLTADVIVEKYLALNQLEKAVHLLNALNWETYGAMCLVTLHKILNYVLFHSDSKYKRIDLVTKALSTFTDSLSEETKDEFSDQVFDLKRRFFFFLLSRDLYADAYQIAKNIEDYDLLMDLYNVTKSNVNFIDISTAAFNEAATILQMEDRANGTINLAREYSSESACLQSTYLDKNTGRIKSPTVSDNQLKNYVPPLSSFKSKIFNAEMIKINIPKPELRIDNAQSADRSIPPLPTIREPLMTPKVTVCEAMNTKYTGTVVKISSNESSISWHDSADLTAGTSTNASLTTTDKNTIPATPYNAMPRISSSATLAPSAHQPYIVPIVGAEETSIVPVHDSYSSQCSIPIAMPGYQPKYYQHPLVSGNIPATLTQYATLERLKSANDEQQKRTPKKATSSILSNSLTAQNPVVTSPLTTNTNSAVNSNTTSKEVGGGKSSNGGEKNKVKFSDTVQVAVVPEIPRKEKAMSSKRNGYLRHLPRNLTNPKKELADSLPLCHPHGEYLKDFNPLSSDLPQQPARKNAKDETTSSKSSASSSSIKVVHFGVV